MDQRSKAEPYRLSLKGKTGKFFKSNGMCFLYFFLYGFIICLFFYDDLAFIGGVLFSAGFFIFCIIVDKYKRVKEDVNKFTWLIFLAFAIISGLIFYNLDGLNGEGAFTNGMVFCLSLFCYYAISIRPMADEEEINILKKRSITIKCIILYLTLLATCILVLIFSVVSFKHQSPLDYEMPSYSIPSGKYILPSGKYTLPSGKYTLPEY